MVLTRSASAAAAAAPGSGPTGAASSSSDPKPANYRYVTEEGVKHILTYRYSGSDASLLYNYAISPLAQKLVDCVLSPQLAPNAITIGG
ncbi:hypothetical protein BBJ28_00006969, partial [Nothophytophthora sp. Chile5]